MTDHFDFEEFLEQHGLLEAAKATDQTAEARLADAFDCISRLHGRELYVRRELLLASAEAARLRKSFSYRLGALLIRHGRSPLGLIKAPVAILRELLRHRRQLGSAANVLVTEGMAPPITITDARATWIVLTGKGQVVTTAGADGAWDIWATALFAPECDDAGVAIQRLRTDTSSEADFGPSDQLTRHRDLAVHKLRLRSGVPARIVKGATGEVSLKLARYGTGFVALKVELRPAAAGQHGSVAKLKRSELGSAQSPPRAVSHRAKEFSASDLDAKLWGGFARYAIPALEDLKSNRLAPIGERRTAAWSLTRWFYVEEQYERALETIEFERELDPPQAHFALAEVQCLVKLGRWRRANAVLKSAAGHFGKYRWIDFQLLRSTVARRRKLERGGSSDRADKAGLKLLNEVFLSAGLSPLRKIREQDPLHLSNLTAVAQPRLDRQHLKVSIVMPAHNAGGTIEWAIASLLRQTWQNLEVIVVDDCSSDDTCEVVEKIAERDPRVKLIRLEQNGGAYVARNAGLGHASGDLITVHDSDDWSHPQRIELQTELLESNPAFVGTKSHWVRVSEELDVIGAWDLKGSVIDLNFSSLLFRRELLEVMGTWDDVRVSGDAEFYSRLKQLYGREAVGKLPRDKLLAFSLARETSLTRAKATHVRSLYFGLRGNYRDSYRYWHSNLSADSPDLPFEPAKARRRFPVPPRNRPPGKQSDGKYDLVVISDFALRGGAGVSTHNYLVAACKAGKKAAVFHWRRFDLAADSAPRPRLYEAAMDYGVDILGPGDTVESDVVLVGYPTILQHKIEPMPDIKAKHLVIVVNQFASRLVDGEDQQYDPLLVRAHLRDIFGMEGVWAPISNWVKRLMQQDHRYPAPYPKPWYPMIDSDSWCSRAIQWRGSERGRPIVGRHGRDTYTKWPSDPESLAQAYGAGQDFEVRFLGGAEHATDMLGGRPLNWVIMPFDEISVEEFLGDLDFYVHYPHEKYIEEFGRGVMEAMAFGIPAILAPQFQETFGDAAIYATPAEVPQVISELWNSRDKYLERAQAGRTFVLRNCSLSLFPDRLDALVAMDEDTVEHESPAIDLSVTTARR